MGGGTAAGGLTRLGSGVPGRARRAGPGTEGRRPGPGVSRPGPRAWVDGRGVPLSASVSKAFTSACRRECQGQGPATQGPGRSLSLSLSLSMLRRYRARRNGPLAILRTRPRPRRGPREWTGLPFQGVGLVCRTGVGGRKREDGSRYFYPIVDHQDSRRRGRPSFAVSTGQRIEDSS